MKNENHHRVAPQGHLDLPQGNSGRPQMGSRPDWQLPPGVSPGTWDYVRNQSIATGYDVFLANDPLAEVDWQIIHEHLPALESGQPVQTVAEFGCGNGRTLIPLMKIGYRCVGIDLSIPMLTQLRQHWDGPPQQLLATHANLVELDGFEDQSIDHGICLFSTLGMIRGANHRKRFLSHARRMIKPGGLFILHAHHVWQMVSHQGGIKWLLRHLYDVASGKMEFGDRFSNYRGIRNMFIHSFRKHALETLLSDAGFKTEAWYGVTRKILDNVPDDLDNAPKDDRQDLLQQMLRTDPFSTKTIGWVIVCR